MKLQPDEFKFNPLKTAKIMAFFASSGIQSLDKLKMCKLLYFVDREHLRKCGKVISGDVYVNMDHGPVPSNFFDEIKSAINGEDSELLNVMEIQSENVMYELFHTNSQPSMEEFSKAELETLQIIADHFGKMSGWDLRELSHRDRSWKETSRNQQIDFSLFFESDDDSMIELLKERRENDLIADCLNG